jgi:hypothetical protein
MSYGDLRFICVPECDRAALLKRPGLFWIAGYLDRLAVRRLSLAGGPSVIAL